MNPKLPPQAEASSSAEIPGNARTVLQQLANGNVLDDLESVYGRLSRLLGSDELSPEDHKAVLTHLKARNTRLERDTAEYERKVQEAQQRVTEAARDQMAWTAKVMLTIQGLSREESLYWLGVLVENLRERTHEHAALSALLQAGVSKEVGSATIKGTMRGPASASIAMVRMNLESSGFSIRGHKDSADSRKVRAYSLEWHEEARAPTETSA